MSYRHIYEPSALVEYKKAISWYQELRETSLKKYPYSIVYFVDEERQLIPCILCISSQKKSAQKI